MKNLILSSSWILIVLISLAGCDGGSGSGGKKKSEEGTGFKEYQPEPTDLRFMKGGKVYAAGLKWSSTNHQFVDCRNLTSQLFEKVLPSQFRIAFGFSPPASCAACIVNIPCTPGEKLKLSVTYTNDNVSSIEDFNAKATNTYSDTTLYCPATGLFSRFVGNSVSMTSMKTTLTHSKGIDEEYLLCQ